MKRRRSSSSVTLVLVGASALAACDQSPQSTDSMRRDMYKSRADCVQDWGTDPAKCESARGMSSTRSGSSHYWGPAYSHGAYGSSSATHADGTSSAARPGSRAIGTAHVSRSGFGSSSSSHSSSSSSASSSGS